ncbi:MAG: hypothetical protein KBT22_05940, partial [Bacteroidales bacterium]|nr:hypothetical protein [Candidatus Scybalocola fimicaballi]
MTMTLTLTRHLKFLPNSATCGILVLKTFKIYFSDNQRIANISKKLFLKRLRSTEISYTFALAFGKERQRSRNESKKISSPREGETLKITIFESICNLRGRTGHKLIYV